MKQRVHKFWTKSGPPQGFNRKSMQHVKTITEDRIGLLPKIGIAYENSLKRHKENGCTMITSS